jgi:hypothetical protein
MFRRRRRDRHGVYLAQQFTIVGHGRRSDLGGHASAAFGVAIANGDELDAVEQTMLLSVKSAEIADADDGRA